MNTTINEQLHYMSRALELAKQGLGAVAPNPMVGCVIVKNGEIIGEGYHRNYGGPHAEIEALNAAGDEAKGSTVYVTLEPCSHFGKTPPCAKALVEAKVAKVVAAMRDPNPLVNGAGLELLQNAGIVTVESVMENEARDLNVKYLTRVEKKRPWIVAKWAMTLDGKIATRTGSSHWISSEASRKLVHKLRGQMDAIMVGSGTALQDDPLLTVRNFDEPTKESQSTERKHPIRVVLDSSAAISLESRLVKTAREHPLLIGVSFDASVKKVEQLQNAGCEIITLPGRSFRDTSESERMRLRDFRPGSAEDRAVPITPSLYERHDASKPDIFRDRLTYLFSHLVRRGVTNLLVEGGGTLLGSLFDVKMIDEVHVFIAPKFVGGKNAKSPIAGLGLAEMVDSPRLESPNWQIVDTDIYIHGRLRYAF